MTDFEADGYDDEAEDDEDAIDGEIEITFEPWLERLDELGITFDDFQEALMAALDQREDRVEGLGAEDDLPPLEEMMLSVGGSSYKLEDLADVEIKQGGSSEADEEDEDEA